MNKQLWTIGESKARPCTFDLPPNVRLFSMPEQNKKCIPAHNQDEIACVYMKCKHTCHILQCNAAHCLFIFNTWVEQESAALHTLKTKHMCIACVYMKCKHTYYILRCNNAHCLFPFNNRTEWGSASQHTIYIPTVCSLKIPKRSQKCSTAHSQDEKHVYYMRMQEVQKHFSRSRMWEHPLKPKWSEGGHTQSRKTFRIYIFQLFMLHYHFY